jgi:predicted nucleic acid-binding protein
MVRLEVERGLRIEKIRHRMAAFFDVLINITTTNNIWKESAARAWSLDRSGITLPSQDILIATCAQEIGAAILTDDNYFEKFEGLQILKPSKEFEGW